MIVRPRLRPMLGALTVGAAVLAGCSTTPPGADAANSAARSAARTSSSPAITPSQSGSTGPSAGGSTASTGTTGAAMALPKGVVDPAAGLVANAGTAKPGAPTLEVFEDFQCPSCAQVHERLGDAVTRLAEAGTIRLVYHPMVFLDEKLGNDSSKTVTNAAACAADAGKYAAYHHAAMSAQSSEGKGFTPAQVQQFAVDAGLTGTQLATWKRCEAAGTFRAYVLASEETALASGVNSTPTVKLNGRELDLGTLTPDALVQAIAEASH